MKLTLESLEKQLEDRPLTVSVMDNGKTYQITASRFTTINNEKIDTIFKLKNDKKEMITKEEFIRIHNALT